MPGHVIWCLLDTSYSRNTHCTEWTNPCLIRQNIFLPIALPLLICANSTPHLQYPVASHTLPFIGIPVIPKQNTLAGLPVELLLSIADFLPPVDAICLSLCNRRLFATFHRRNHPILPLGRDEIPLLNRWNEIDRVTLSATSVTVFTNMMPLNTLVLAQSSRINPILFYASQNGGTTIN
ncbi:hypothetical protein N7517_006186 [Penicillium concentricum]|uniref:F-box domain-containing protein n=1 Tax=Penicillium concentricum TaxID=293559 RepID=A0A9W9S9A3_9EURO|nr:uncharacterized protein N7517_006186 [Penicillium concentricum]KAJ5374180.1 hypothetical protein N7517_006186 [Penicillium concentricum]